MEQCYKKKSDITKHPLKPFINVNPDNHKLSPNPPYLKANHSSKNQELTGDDVFSPLYRTPLFSLGGEWEREDIEDAATEL